MKPVNMTTPYLICEDENYKRYFCRADADEFEVAHLWGVIVHWQFGCATVYVLAANKADAISQARCRLELESYRISPLMEESIKIECTQLPLVIRGWGKTDF